MSRMPLELVYSGKALADLEIIMRYIAIDNPRAARRWVAAIETKCEGLRSFPEIGVERPDVAKGLRIFPFRRSVIAYRILPGRIRIVRVLHGGQDYAALIES
jgi:toxin ParE1/3/4